MSKMYDNITLANKILRKINLKEDFLNSLLPHSDYIKVLHHIELLQNLSEGVQSPYHQIDNETTQLNFIRNELINLRELYDLLSIKLEEIYVEIDTWNLDKIIEYFFNDIHKCKKYLIQTFKQFQDEINSILLFIYDIDIINRIETYIDNIKNDLLNVFLINLENLLRSIESNTLKAYLKSFFAFVAIELEHKINGISETFPKFHSIRNDRSSIEYNQNNRSNHCSNKIDQTSIYYNLNEIDNNNKKMNDSNEEGNGVNLNDIIDEEVLKSAISVTTLQESERYSSQNIIDKYKTELRQISSRVIQLQKEKCFLLDEIQLRTKEFQFRKTVLEKETQKLNSKSFTDIKTKTEELQKFHNDMLNLEKEENEILNNLKMKIDKNQNQLIVEIERLKQIKITLSNERYCLIDKFERLKNEYPERVLEKAKKKIKLFENEFQIEMDYIEKLEGNLIKTQGFDFHFDKNDAASSSESSTFQEDVVQSKVNYVKNVLGKPLVYGLAALAFYQPTDPIHYLANYLLHYRHVEMQNVQKRKAFEELLHERSIYAEKKRKESQQKCLLYDSDNKNVTKLED